MLCRKTEQEQIQVHFDHIEKDEQNLIKQLFFGSISNAKRFCFFGAILKHIRFNVSLSKVAPYTYFFIFLTALLFLLCCFTIYFYYAIPTFLFPCF